MKKYIFLLIGALAMMTSSCSSEFDLEQSVFISDVAYPGLPIYSEWGYNTFGAYFDRKPFISNNTELPAKIIVNDDTLNIIMKGQIVEGYNYAYMSLKISVVGHEPLDYPDLISLNNREINLAGDNVRITMTRNGVTTGLYVFDGKMHFRKAQKLLVDKELTKTILSGVFQFKTFIDSEPVAISNGRFDFGIGYENFYNY